MPDPAADDLKGLVTQSATDAGLDPEFVHRLIGAESNWNPSAVSPKGATGLMQLMPDTAKQYGVTNLTDPKENIKAGIAHLKRLKGKYGDRDDLVAAAYNAGEGTVDKANGVPNIAETRNYVQKVAGPSAPDVLDVKGQPVAAAETAPDVLDVHGREVKTPATPAGPPKSGPPATAPGARPFTFGMEQRTNAAGQTENVPTTYGQDVIRYGTEELKRVPKGVVSFLNPYNYLAMAKGAAEGVRDLPAYVRGFSMDDIRQLPGEVGRAAGEFVEDPGAVGESLGSVVGGRVGLTPTGVARGTARAAAATSRAVKAAAPTVAPAVARYGTEAAAAKIGRAHV